MSKIIKSGLFALVLAIATMYAFFLFGSNDATEIHMPSDAIVQFSFGWPLEAGKGSSGGIGGGLNDITYNKINLALDFSLFLLVYFALLNFRFAAKPKNRKKKEK